MSFPTYPSSSPELSKIGHRLVGEQNLTPQNVSSACGLLPTEKIKALKGSEWNFDFHLKCLKEFSSVPRKELSLENTAKILSRGGGNFKQDPEIRAHSVSRCLCVRPANIYLPNICLFNVMCITFFLSKLPNHYP